MVACFSPLVEGISRRVRRLSIFERGSRLTPDLLPEDGAAELLPQCSVNANLMGWSLWHSAPPLCLGNSPAEGGWATNASANSSKQA